MRVLCLAFLLALALPASAQTYASGLTVTLPEDWSGPETVDESEMPRTASYRYENTNAASALHGAVVHVERITGLNPMMQARWQQGRVPFGYHGARPVAALPREQVPFVRAAGVRTERDGRTGAVYFVTVGTTYWAVQVEVPDATAEADPDVLTTLARSVRLGASE